MYHFEYVPYEETKPYRNEFIEIVEEVIRRLEGKLKIKYYFVGSSRNDRNMITYDPQTYSGYDFDINLRIMSPVDYSPAEIKIMVMNAFNAVAMYKGYEYCKGHTRVFTLKKRNLRFPFKDVEPSCDFAIVREFTDKVGHKHKQYIHYQKSNNQYSWNEQTKSLDIDDKVNWLRNKGAKVWNEVRDLYLRKKNNNTDINKKSRALFAETINEVYARHNKPITKKNKG